MSGVYVVLRVALFPADHVVISEVAWLVRRPRNACGEPGNDLSVAVFYSQGR